MEWKWGIDGSSGQSEYNQALEGGPGRDSSVFMICVVPIRLISLGPLTNVVWQNPNCSSTFLCRPVKFFFASENSPLILREHANMNNQIDNLHATGVVGVDNCRFNIVHNLELTMVDVIV